MQEVANKIDSGATYWSCLFWK